jgi:BirA family biotin operon repressor/biotin-[acetyl-CoA-carboxylase] ligase
MRSMNHPLSAQRIAASRRASALPLKIEVVAETGSTNADLLARLAGLQSPLALAAERQTAGRGRAGRPWHSEPGATLTFSLAWKFDQPLHALAGLPLAVGVAIAETLARFGVDARLKWPNDVLKDGSKLAGILIETAAAGPASHAGIWAVIGIGINIAVTQGMVQRIGRPAADMPALRDDRNALMGALLDSLTDALLQFEADGFAAFAPRWNLLHAYAGMPVAILDRGRVLHEGRADGVDHSGCLLLHTAAGRIAVMAGDVSLRAVEG